MRGLVLLVLFFSVLAFMLPFILGLFGVLAISVCVLLLLSKFGLFGRGRSGPFRVYTFSSSTKRTDSRETGKRVIFEEPQQEQESGESAWYQSTQEGEVITLPENALKKEQDE